MDSEVKGIMEAVIITVVGLSLLGVVTSAVTSALTVNVTSNTHFAGLVTVTYVIPIIYVLIILGADAYLLYSSFRS